MLKITLKGKNLEKNFTYFAFCSDLYWLCRYKNTAKLTSLSGNTLFTDDKDK
jgi:hypothetical protein